MDGTSGNGKRLQALGWAFLWTWFELNFSHKHQLLGPSVVCADAITGIALAGLKMKDVF